MKILFECIAFIMRDFSADKFLFHRLIIQMAHFWKTQAKYIKEVIDITFITFSRNQMIKNQEIYISIFLLLITKSLLRNTLFQPMTMVPILMHQNLSTIQRISLTMTTAIYQVRIFNNLKISSCQYVVLLVHTGLCQFIRLF